MFARRSDLADRERRLRGAGLVDEIDRRAASPRVRPDTSKLGIDPPRGQVGELFLELGLDGVGLHITDDGDDRAARLEVRAMKRDDVVASDRAQRRLRRHACRTDDSSCTESFGYTDDAMPVGAIARSA